MKAYKGFNKDMTCRGFQYKEGETYETDRADLCHTGFHACENPLDCFGYYGPADSVYHEVELDETPQKACDDSKRVGKKIKIGARLTIGKLVQASMIDTLTDAEAGRYLKAVLHYAQGDEVVDLPGKEQLAFLSMLAQIDRDRASYDKKAAANRENGRLGGRPSQAARENPNNPDGSDKTQPNPAKAKITQDKSKTRVRQDTTPLPPPGAEAEAERNAEALGNVLDAAAGIGLKSGRDMETANLLVADYGADMVLAAIAEAAEGSPTARCWRYIRKVLENAKLRGGVHVPKGEAYHFWGGGET